MSSTIPQTCSYYRDTLFSLYAIPEPSYQRHRNLWRCNLQGPRLRGYALYGAVETAGKSGDRPNTAFVSAYRDIDYDTVEDAKLERAYHNWRGFRFGANPNSWQATPTNGRRNTDLKIVSGSAVIELISISTPGAKHVKGIHVGRLTQSSVSSNVIVINEVRNDTSTDNVDWVELKNIGSGIQQIKDWELSIVTKEVTDAGLVVLKDTDLVDLPEYELASGEILLLLNEAPWVTPIAAGVNAADVDSQRVWEHLLMSSIHDLTCQTLGNLCS